MLKSLPAAITSAVSAGVSRHWEAQAAADHLAAIMSDINGGDWRVSIDHENAFILICQDFDEPVETVDSGEKSP